jgi:hypothetical protein
MTDNSLEPINIDSIQSIESRTERINLLHKSILLMQIKSFEYGVMIGKELSEQKAELPHGHFIKWIETNIPSISRMTANRYLRVYENQDFLREKLGDSLEINRAYKLLSKPQKTINPKNKNEVLKNKLDNHLLDSIKLHKQKVTHAKKNLLKGKPINKIEKKLLQKDTQEKRNKILSSIDKARARLEKLEEILSKLEM